MTPPIDPARLVEVQAACLKWIGIIRIGPGGYPHHVVSRCAACAATGGDWEAIRLAHLSRPKVRRAVGRHE